MARIVGIQSGRCHGLGCVRPVCDEPGTSVEFGRPADPSELT